MSLLTSVLFLGSAFALSAPKHDIHLQKLEGRQPQLSTASSVRLTHSSSSSTSSTKSSLPSSQVAPVAYSPIPEVVSHPVSVSSALLSHTVNSLSYSRPTNVLPSGSGAAVSSSMLSTASNTAASAHATGSHLPIPIFPFLPYITAGVSGHASASRVQSAMPVTTGTSYDNSTTDDGIDPFAWTDFQMCDYTLTFKDLDDLNAKAGGLRSDCVAKYTLDVLISMLDVAYKNYTSVNDGYDKEFGYYVTYMKKLIPAVLDNNFMFNESTTTQHMQMPSIGPGMQYFDCKVGKDQSTINCGDLSKHTQDAAYYTTAMTLRDHDGYAKALLNAGISMDWTDFGDYEKDHDLVEPRAGRRFKYKFTGFPIENATMVVPNPKDIVTKGLGSIPDLRTAMQATALDIMMGLWTNGSVTDVAEAYSTPVFMLIQAVDNMAQAKALGSQEEKEEEKEEEERKKNLILLIISIVLIFVPVVGEEVAAAAGFASLARAISILGELGNAAMGVYDTVQDPNSALINVLGMLVGVGAIAKASRDGKGVAEIAATRRGMKADTVTSLGALFKANDDKLQTVVKMCKWK